ncbi:LysM peptidoglycan-binding domain-containing protein [Paenibacillus sp. YYML68]|uniref:LysM peptidoglycan-binding domain-containing protein n=1 Tax=Paenibacillus sp. YYML68 TaxID=2909250 RepID=UPI0024911591|nr:LysM peptidoglycan-binding domain-containing protein [Paenibacillus sp. YYML68]
MSEYGIYLSWNNQEEGFRIPVNPESLEMKDSGGDNKTYAVSGGEISVIKDPKLTEIGFSSEFPAQQYPFVVGNLLAEPMYYVDLIRKWMRTRMPIRFVFTGSSFDLNLPVSIERFEWKEAAGSPGDIEYTLHLKKYVFFAAKRVSVAATGQGAPQLVAEAPSRPSERVPPKTYTIADGDTLWLIAKKLLGDGARFKELQSLNGITDAQMRALPVGMELRMPEGKGYA